MALHARNYTAGSPADAGASSSFAHPAAAAPSRISSRCPAKKWSASGIITSRLGSAASAKISLQLRRRCELVAVAAHAAAWAARSPAAARSCTARPSALHRRAQQDQRLHPRMRNRRAQPDGRAEGEARKEDRQRESLGQVVERNPRVGDLSAPVVVLSRAGSHAAKVEAQHRKAEAVQHLHRVEDDLVVHGAAEERMRMADQRTRIRASAAPRFSSASSLPASPSRKSDSMLPCREAHPRAFSLIESSTATPVLPSREVSGRFEWQVASSSVCAVGDEAHKPVVALLVAEARAGLLLAAARRSAGVRPPEPYPESAAGSRAHPAASRLRCDGRRSRSRWSRWPRTPPEHRRWSGADSRRSAPRCSHVRAARCRFRDESHCSLRFRRCGLGFGRRFRRRASLLLCARSSLVLRSLAVILVLARSFAALGGCGLLRGLRFRGHLLTLTPMLRLRSNAQSRSRRICPRFEQLTISLHVRDGLFSARCAAPPACRSEAGS